MTAISASTTPRLSCPLDAIDARDLLRKDVGDVSDICASLQANIAAGLPALIHPVVVDGNMKLISGSRRLAAHRKLGLAEIDYNFYAVLDDAERVRLEVEANYQKPFTWQERVLGIDKHHRFHSLRAALRGESWGVRETGSLLRISKSPVGKATFIAEYLHANDKEIWSAESMEDAYRVLIKREEEAAAKLLVSQSVPTGKPVAPKPVKRAVSDDTFFDSLPSFLPAINAPVTTDETPGAAAAVTTVPLSQILLKQDGHTGLSTLLALGAGCCDHIITDPPYGIDMEMLNQQNDGPGAMMKDLADVATEHDVAENLVLLHRFIPLAYQAIRDRGFLVMWADAMNWQFLYEECVAAGFKVQRWPLIWFKTSSCMNQSAQYNFTKNYEIAIVCRKGNATLATHQKSAIWTGGNDFETKLYGHPFAKPEGLWNFLYSAVAIRGADVLDPFAGSCSSGIPAIRLGLRWRGIECSEKHYATGMTNLMNIYKALDPNCVFA